MPLLEKKMIPYCQKLSENFKTLADKLCIKDQIGNCITYGEMDALTGKVSAYLKANGVKKGDFIFINLPRGATVYAAALGAIRAGVPFVVLEAGAAESRSNYIKKDCGCVLTVDANCWCNILDADPDTTWTDASDSDALCAIYTSGTTGNPKGALHLRGMLDRNVQTFQCDGKHLAEEPQNFAVIFPLNFVAFEITTIFPYYGGTLFILDYTTIKTPHLFYNYFEENKIESVFMTPSFLRTYRKINSSMRQIFIGGEVSSDIEELPIPVYNFFGMGEMGHLLAIFKMDGRKGTVPVGKPTIPGSISLSEQGEICIKNPYFSGYIGLAQLNSERIKNGIFHTGDIGKLLPDGNLVHLGRLDSMIKINGNRVEPEEVLAVLKKTDNSAWCAVKGFKKSTAAYLCAYYTGAAGFDANLLRRELEIRLPEYMIPTFFVHLEKEPISASGKLEISSLPEPELAEYRAPYAAPSTALEKALCRSFGQALDIEPFGMDDDFVQLGADSIALAEVVAECNITGLSFEEIYNVRTVRKLVHYYNSALKETI